MASGRWADWRGIAASQTRSNETASRRCLTESGLFAGQQIASGPDSMRWDSPRLRPGQLPTHPLAPRSRRPAAQMRQHTRRLEIEPLSSARHGSWPKPSNPQPQTQSPPSPRKHHVTEIGGTLRSGKPSRQRESRPLPRASMTQIAWDGTRCLAPWFWFPGGSLRTRSGRWLTTGNVTTHGDPTARLR